MIRSFLIVKPSLKVYYTQTTLSETTLAQDTDQTKNQKPKTKKPKNKTHQNDSLLNKRFILKDMWERGRVKKKINNLKLKHEK